MIAIKTKEEITILREGGRILAEILNKLKDEVEPGVTTGDLEEIACHLIAQAGGRPSFKGYKNKHDLKPFPTALCTSINNEVVHAPSLPARKLKAGDIIGIDIGMAYPSGQGRREYYTDVAITLPVGKVSQQARELIKVTRESLALAIKKVKPGNTLSLIGSVIEHYVEKENSFFVVRDLVGHGVGYDVHEEPQVPNFVSKEKKFTKVVLKPGMVIAIEPMVNIGSWPIKVGTDNFTILTTDGSLSAHFEHTVAVSDEGGIILTER